MLRTRKLVLAMVAMAVAMFALSWLSDVYAQKKQTKPKTAETYTRPKPREPIKPQIPSVNRFQDDKVFLENADSLYRPANEYEEYQIVKGKVKFRQGNMWMFCDSAYYYPQKNSMDAFGHVEMQQGDTLFVYSDRLYYDGFEKLATLVNGPSRSKVELRNRKVTLTTDSLNYSVATETGWYTTGGVLDDGVNTLTSVYGEYSPNTKEAKFRDNVLLVNNKDGYRLITEELDYNTATHIADINTKTVIEGANDTIVTTQGTYNTSTDHAQLTARSTITHRDSLDNVTWLEGDSIIYDKATGISRAYMFRNPMRDQQPMVITDTARKVQLIGGYGEYDDRTRRAMATEYPLLIEYSRPDSLFLRADTIISLIQPELVWPDTLDNNFSAATRRRFAAMESILDLAKGVDVELYLYPASIPTVIDMPSLSPGAPARSENKVPGRPMPDVTYDDRDVPDDRSLSVETPRDTAAGAPVRRLDALGRDSALMVPKDFHVARAIGRARFFNKDIQGVADTLLYREYDSLLYMIRKPIVWSGERQAMGNIILVHLNDSTADWAYLPDNGMLAEHVDEDFYNQIMGSVMKAWIENQKIRRMTVDGNVQVVMLPQENDSTFNKLVNAESSHLAVDFDKGVMEHLKMWPEVTGQVSPVGMVKMAQKYLPGFRWLDMLRPRRQWYGDRVRWIDDLGEVPDELEIWCNEPEQAKRQPLSPADYKEKMRINR